ncbi:MAG: methionine synthase [Lachnospiraceae bacterium]|nr:methionine synthase [Lachnospiraceae bacterium]
MNVGAISLTEIDKKTAERYLGYGTSSADPVTSGLLEKCEEELLSEIQARYVYKIFDLKDGQPMGCSLYLPGNSIREHLKGASKALFLCATLSSAVDRLIRKKQIGSMAEAMVTDALASAAIEQVLDQAEARIFAEYPFREHTWRFSPGYGDLPLEIQGSFLDILDAPKRIGVCVSPGLLLTPTKSVTAIIGLGEHIEKKHRKTCEICTLRGNCRFRPCGTEQAVE